MASDYNITFLHGFMGPDGGASFSFNADMDGKLIMTKEKAFATAFSDQTKIVMADGSDKSKCEADRVYLHYIIDCWLDDKPVDLQPGEIV
jgi:hypothetical protein